MVVFVDTAFYFFFILSYEENYMMNQNIFQGMATYILLHTCSISSIAPPFRLNWSPPKKEDGDNRNAKLENSEQQSTKQRHGNVKFD